MWCMHPLIASSSWCGFWHINARSFLATRPTETYFFLTTTRPRWKLGAADSVFNSPIKAYCRLMHKHKTIGIPFFLAILRSKSGVTGNKALPGLYDFEPLCRYGGAAVRLDQLLSADGSKPVMDFARSWRSDNRQQSDGFVRCINYNFIAADARK